VKALWSVIDGGASGSNGNEDRDDGVGEDHVAGGDSVAGANCFF
jgi:hypothetical protein